MFIDGGWVDAARRCVVRHRRPGDGRGAGHRRRGRGRRRRSGRRSPPGARSTTARWGSAVAERDRAAAAAARWPRSSASRRDELAELEVRDCGKPIADAASRHRRGRVHVRVLRRLGDEDHRRHPARRPRRDEPRRQGAGRRLRAHRAVELPDAHGRPEGRPGPRRRVARSSSSRPSRPRSRRCAWPRSPRRPGCRPACSTSSPASAPTPGAPLLTHPGVDKISFTGSKEIGS